MKGYGHDTVALKQHFGKKLMELEEEKRAVQVCHKIFKLLYSVNKSCIFLAQPRKMLILQGNLNTFQKERDRLLAEVESLNADGQTHKVRDAQLQKLKTFEAQVNGSS